MKTSEIDATKGERAKNNTAHSGASRKNAMRQINKIVVHCSATSADQDIGVEEIRAWHLERGWADIGYHIVIRRNGVIERGRPLSLIGAHVKGHNHDSVGICWVGGRYGIDNRTGAQRASLETVVKILHDIYPDADIKGHRDFGVPKECPSFDVAEWLKEIGIH